MISLDTLLRKVTRPARYTGGEWNSIVKDWGAVEVRMALVYPDLYEIGMSNLGLSILYDLLNKEPHVLAERAYAPWVDMAAALRREGYPLFSLESQRPLKDFDIIGFSLGYELTYTNVLNVLDLAQIPLLSSHRGEADPLIIAGGSCALNPEPMADFIDLFAIGEGEEVLLEFVETFRTWKREGGSREDLLRQCAHLPGIYVPSFYRMDYNPDGTLAEIRATVPEASPTIERRLVAELPPPPTKPLVPYIEAIHDRAAVEIQRGCTRGCRFCQAGVIYRPVRERPGEEVLRAVDELVRNCGYEEVSFLSLSSSDYQGLEELVRSLAERYKGKNLTLSLPSLRMDTFSVGLADSIPGRRKGGLTFAPEAGTERLRQVINKAASEEELLRAVETAAARGWSSFKLYFMLGLPTETLEDIEGIVAFVHKVRQVGRKARGGEIRVRVTASTFIPKPHTPCQWMAQIGEEELGPRIEVLKKGLRRLGTQFSWQDPKMSLIEGVMARGDRRLGRVIKRAWEMGCLFDAWTEHFNYERWLAAFEENDLNLSFYAHRPRPLEELLPWAHIDSGVSLPFLTREYQRLLGGEESWDCRYRPCLACGLERRHLSCQRKRKALSPQTGAPAGGPPQGF